MTITEDGAVRPAEDDVVARGEQVVLRRKRLADAAGVPPFVVFGDATLAEMAACRPTCEEALLQVNGVGRHKCERYGAEFLAEILRHRGE